MMCMCTDDMYPQLCDATAPMKLIFSFFLAARRYNFIIASTRTPWEPTRAPSLCWWGILARPKYPLIPP